MGEYIHLGLSKEVMEIIDSKAKQNYLNRAEVARQYLMKSLVKESITELRQKGYSISSISEALGITSRQVLETLKDNGVDEELYPDDEEKQEKTVQKLLKKS